MTPTALGVLLGDFTRGAEALASIDPNAGPAVSRAIRESFTGGNEQGNERRLRALVLIEGEGALDVMAAVLEDTVEVGGIYSNLRNVALDLMRSRFPGHPRLAAPLWRALEIDEYLHIDLLYPVVAAYDPDRAMALVLPDAQRGVPAALAILAANPGARPALLALLDEALASEPERAGRFIEALGATALQPELARRIVALADTLPAAAEVAAATDPARAREVADRLSSKDARWRIAALKALAHLPREEVFERASALFTGADSAKPVGRARIVGLVWSATPFDDPRWTGFLTGRLAKEELPKLRGLLVRALGMVGPAAVDAIVAAPKDDADAGVLAELPTVLTRLRGGLIRSGRWEQSRAGVLASVSAAADSAPKGKRKQALTRALKALKA
jgi:hypothetical protein